MRVAFDMTAAITGRGGSARHTTEVTRALEELGVDVARFALGRASVPPPPRTRHLGLPLRALERVWRVAPVPTAERLAGGRADVVHLGIAFHCPTRRPCVVTIHDLAAIDYPQFHPLRHIAMVQAQLDFAVRTDVVITTGCETAKSSLIDHGIAPDRVVVTPYGAGALPAPEPAPGVNGPFILTVGETSPRKDLLTLVSAFASTHAPDDVQLVIAGPEASGEAELRDRIASLHIQDRVHRLNDASDAEIAWLFAHAIVLCFPSIAEGFGLPVVEAMRSECPVIASDIPVMREVGGPAASFVPVGDVEGWIGALDAVVTDAALRERMAKAGPAQASRFTWERCAEKTLEAYETASDRGTRSRPRGAG